VFLTINISYILTIIYIALLIYIYFKETNLETIKNSTENTRFIDKIIIKKGKNPISLSFLPILIFITIYLYLFGFDEKIISEANTIIKKINDLVKDKTNYDTFMINIENVRFLVNLLPSFISSYAILISYTTIQLIAKKNNHFLFFKIPDTYIPIFIILGFCIVINNNLFKLISVNSLIIFSTLFFLQGFDILNYILNTWIKRPIFKIFIYVLIFTQLPLIILLTLFGIFDNWFNFTNYIDKKINGK
ncbi:MAG: DUF2232 domain-containing protein, partial [Deferribacterota bacterium]|nr:DUF2232 domain-containing protein [Deferribacterota bacterium]